ncbi:MAG: nuA3 HAT complex component nto1 [Candelina submexicana]|nr:MAG: nuA3 HAT complex component nto1 [Candelina submexicana]
MPPLSPDQSRASNSRGRGPGRPRGRASNPKPTRPVTITANGNPPPKKRRYIPGGPGGGGRYVDDDGTETPVGGTGPGGYAYVGPRGPIGRENAANGVTPIVYTRPRREKVMARPRYSSAAAAAAAVVQGDGYKPREERGWEEFHPDLDIDAKLAVYDAAEVDGTTAPADSLINSAQVSSHNIQGGFDPLALSANRLQNGDRNMRTNDSDFGGKDGNIISSNGEGPITQGKGDATATPLKRRPGRPPRRPDSLLSGIITPNVPKIVPPPGPNPRERLTLPKPSFRKVDTFRSYEQKAVDQQNYVDRTMANVGYQESDIFIRPERRLIRVAEGTIEEDLDLGPGFQNESETNTALGSVGVGTVEYDMDEQDAKWLEAYNVQRKSEQLEPIKPAIFEITITKIEKEWHALEKRIPKPNPKPPQTHRPRSSSAAAVNGEPTGAGEEQDSKCAICDDGDCENTNAIVFCDGCDLAVHQECYGVPFIPEGQWLCRKCQLIGRGTPTCIFCPNTDGAFKQTNSSRWSHLLCAIWIPEVTLGNSSFMEPVMDVEKVPRQRWKLTCYICRQKMGACIQCGNKNCFIAFHVTCARRARLFLKMKSTHGGPANLDASVLKAFCDKHVPNEWRKENDVDSAIVDAQDFYHHTMRGRVWADSQQSAMAIVQRQQSAAPEPIEADVQSTVPRINLTIGGNKRKRNAPQKTVWRLPSGAPVVPQIIYNSVVSSLQRFGVRKRKEFVAEACKYWTLKREARRGAPLLKRLQLQMETFSSMEITRRNFAGMGAAGRVRLQRRIDFAETLQEDIGKLRLLCDAVKRRERYKLNEVELLKTIVDTVYFPITPLLLPIIEKAQNLDGKNVFREGLRRIRSKLEAQFYTSVSGFSTDLEEVFSSVVGFSAIEDLTESKLQSDGVLLTEDLTFDQKERRKLAKRIVKAIQPALEDAIHKEAELGGKPFEKELKEFDDLLSSSMPFRRNSTIASAGEDGSDGDPLEPENSVNVPHGKILTKNHKKLNNAILSNQLGDAIVSTEGGAFTEIVPTFVPAADQKPASTLATTAELLPADGKATSAKGARETQRSSNQPLSESVDSDGQTANPSTHEPHERAAEHEPHDLPATLPDLSLLQTESSSSPTNTKENLLAPLSQGGIPWYMKPFDPIGTTIHEERWTGREVVRGMSEELSEIDDEELRGLVDEEMEEAGQENENDNVDPAVATIAGAARRGRGRRGRARR